MYINVFLCNLFVHFTFEAGLCFIRKTQMDTQDYIGLGFGLVIGLIIIGVIVWCLWGCTKQKCETCWSIWSKCILSLGDCDWCRERLSNFRFRSNRRSGAMEISTICDDNPNIYGINFIPPPSYNSVMYLPNYEEAMQIQIQ